MHVCVVSIARLYPAALMHGSVNRILTAIWEELYTAHIDLVNSVILFPEC